MTTKTCDSCGEKCSTSIGDKFEFTGELLLSANIKSTLPFKFTVEVTNYQFCTTNLDFCRACIFDAMKKAIDKVSY